MKKYRNLEGDGEKSYHNTYFVSTKMTFQMAKNSNMISNESKSQELRVSGTTIMLSSQLGNESLLSKEEEGKVVESIKER